MDGLLDEPAWNAAVAVRLPYETRPGENVSAPVETVCLLLYDRRTLYVAFRAHDGEASAIRAHLSDRDTAWNDDFVGVVLDPFNDQRRAFEFFVNPLGVQMDLFMDDVGGSEDSSWDAVWESAGRVHENGFTVEMAIPFHQLRFPRREGAQTWGFEALRFYPRQDRVRISSQPLDRGRNCYLCQLSKITGLEGISPGLNLELVPTVTAGRTDAREDDEPQNPYRRGEFDSEAGITMRWGVTPNLSLNFALNPDFSQVEADVAQLEVNRQFTLSFPERRPFFLEGADFFRTPLKTVFTRNVSDPDWGLKFSGKQGKNAFGCFVAQDEVTTLVFPGSQESDSEVFEFPTTDTVLRYRRDFGSASAVGALLTDRKGSDFSSRIYGVDGLHRFTGSESLRFQFLRSQTEYPTAIAQAYEQPSSRLDDGATLLELIHDSRGWNAWAQYEDVGREFRADMGFMPRVDYRYAATGLERIWWGAEGDWYNRIEWGAEWRYGEDQSGQLLDRGWDVWAEAAGPLQSEFGLSLGRSRRFFDGVIFHQTLGQAWIQVRPTGRLGLGMVLRAGDDIDFEHTRPADSVEVETELELVPSKRLRAELSHLLERLDVAGGRLFTAHLTQLRLMYQLNIHTFLRAVVQHTSVDRDPRLYLEPEDARQRRFFQQLLFSYKVNPQTVIFLGYSSTRAGDDTVISTRTNRSMFLKLGYAWLR